MSLKNRSNNQSGFAKPTFLLEVLVFTGIIALAVAFLPKESFSHHTAAGAGMTWTDSAINSGTTFIRTDHFTELRTRINAKRATCNATATYAFTGTPTVDQRVRAPYMNDLRTAVSAIYNASPSRSMSFGNFTDDPVVAGSTIIRDIHIEELRTAIEEATCCGDGVCDCVGPGCNVTTTDPTYNPETCSNCSSDCGCCPVDCVGSWSGWGACSTTCGPGTQTRTYSISVPASCGGAACPFADGATQTQACDPGPCAVCPNGSCEAGETAASCPCDCGTPPPCAAANTIACGTAYNDTCGNACGTGTGCAIVGEVCLGGVCQPSVGCPDATCDTAGGEDQCNCPLDCGSPSCAAAASIPCGDAYTDSCGTACGTGTGFNIAQCAVASSVPCGNPINDSCGNLCGGGTFCPGAGEACIAGSCQVTSAICPGNGCEAGEDQCNCPVDCGSPTCAAASTVTCGQNYFDICGTLCGQGTLCVNAGETCSGGSCSCTSTGCPASSTALCGVALVDNCGTTCGTGTAYNSGQCAAPSTVSCGTAINDNCGNSCGTTGTSCSGSDTCSGGVCTPPTNSCGGWSNTSCGGGSCPSTQMQQQRTCTVTGVESQCVTMTSCAGCGPAPACPSNVIQTGSGTAIGDSRTNTCANNWSGSSTTWSCNILGNWQGSCPTCTPCDNDGQWTGSCGAPETCHNCPSDCGTPCTYGTCPYWYQDPYDPWSGWYACSDRRIKENIILAGQNNGINLYEFNFKDNVPECGDSQKRYVGVLAQEVQDIKPDAVKVLDNGYLGVDYGALGIAFGEAPGQ